MKKKNGFVSMSIIYSFFAVFTLVSSSLLLVYSTNLSVVKEQNREIKNEITKKGNDAMMPFKNIIVDGGFEEFYVHSTNFNWGKKYEMKNGTYELVDDIRSKKTVLRGLSGGDYKGAWRYKKPAAGSAATENDYLKRLIMGDDAVEYTGSGALGFKGKEKDGGITGIHNMVQSNQTIHMYNNHYYYISRVYYSWADILGSELILGLMQYDNPETDYANDRNNWEDNAENWNISSDRYFNILDKARGYDGSLFEQKKYYNTDINSSRTRYESGYCLGVNKRCADPSAASHCEKSPDWAVTKEGGTCHIIDSRKSNTNANTFESGVFLFTMPEGEYRLIIGENFDESSTTGVQPYYVSDNYILIDLNVSLQYDVDELKNILNPPGLAESGIIQKYRNAAHNIDDMLDGRYFEGSKVFSKARFSILG